MVYYSCGSNLFFFFLLHFLHFVDTWKVMVQKERLSLATNLNRRTIKLLLIDVMHQKCFPMEVISNTDSLPQTDDWVMKLAMNRKCTSVILTLELFINASSWRYRQSTDKLSKLYCPILKSKSGTEDLSNLKLNSVLQRRWFCVEHPIWVKCSTRMEGEWLLRLFQKKTVEMTMKWKSHFSSAHKINNILVVLKKKRLQLIDIHSNPQVNTWNSCITIICVHISKLYSE